MSSTIPRALRMASVLMPMILTAGLALAPIPAQAQTPLSPTQALSLAIEANPELRATHIEVQRAELVVEREDHRRVPLLTAETGYRYGLSPGLTATGTRLIDSSALTLSARLAHTLPVGTQVALSTSVARSVRDSVELGDLGVAYDANFGLDVTQPLLRGFGTNIVDAQIRAARLSQRSVDAQQLAAASSVVQAVLVTYWDLWLAQQAVEIQEAALTLAQRNLANAEVRLETGVISPAELIPLRLEVVSVEERLVIARAAVQTRSTELARLLGQNPRVPLTASIDQAPEVAIPDLEAALLRFREQSFELERLELNIANARIQAELAANDALPRLDAVASFQVAGLDRSPLGAFAELGKFNAFVAFAGLRLELPVINRTRQAEAQRAELAVVSAQMEYDRVAAINDARIVSLLGDLHATRERVELARQSAELARQNVDAQTARFETGRGTAMDVVQALQRLQEAELRIVETEVDIVRRVLTVDDLTGDLLDKWNISL